MATVSLTRDILLRVAIIANSYGSERRFVKRYSFIALVVLSTLSGCAALDTNTATAREHTFVETFSGTYQGSFGSALTEDPSDDLNFNPCDSTKQRCLSTDAYLADIVLDLSQGADGAVRLRFFRSLSDQRRGTELDLLGPGCHTDIGPLRSLQYDSESGDRLATFPLTAGNPICLNKLRPARVHEIKLTLDNYSQSAVRIAHVRIDKNVVSANYLYVVQDGVRRRVKIDLDKSLRTRPRTRYRVCIENDYGEFTDCVFTDQEMKQALLPVPLPGGVAINYTWWHTLTPNLKRTRGLYRVEQYSGRFATMAP